MAFERDYAQRPPIVSLAARPARTADDDECFMTYRNRFPSLAPCVKPLVCVTIFAVCSCPFLSSAIVDAMKAGRAQWSRAHRRRSRALV